MQIEIRCGKCGGKLTLVKARLDKEANSDPNVVVQADPCQTCIVDAKRQFDMLANFVDMTRAMEKNHEPEGYQGIGPVQFPDPAKILSPGRLKRFVP